MSGSKPLTFLAGVAAIPLVALAIAGCGGDSGGQATAAVPKTSGGRTATIGAANISGLGKILVDSKGRSVYHFQKDTGSRSTCSGACATNWPPVTTKGKPTAGSGLTASKLGTTTRGDGTKQVTYNGHPLYRFAADNGPGNAGGQGVNAFGALWYVVSPAGNVITTKPSNSSPSNGY